MSDWRFSSNSCSTDVIVNSDIAFAGVHLASVRFDLGRKPPFQIKPPTRLDIALWNEGIFHSLHGLHTKYLSIVPVLELDATCPCNPISQRSSHHT